MERLHEEVDKRLAAQERRKAALETRTTFVVGLSVALAQVVLAPDAVPASRRTRSRCSGCTTTPTPTCCSTYSR